MRMLIGDQWVESKKRMSVFNPYSGECIDTVPSASADDMRRAIDSAVEGFEISRNLPVHRRIEILRCAAQLVASRKEAMAQLITEEGIKTIREARKEVDRCVQTLTISAEEARRIVGETIPFNSAAGSENRAGYYFRVPIGIIAAITPFNDPMNLVAHKLGPAIASGNAVVLKPSDYTPLCALRLGEILLEAGLPPKIINIVTGPAENFGNTLIADERVRMISFTGGTRTAQKIAQQAGLKRMSMELGSSSPVIVMDDAELDRAVDLCVSGAFWAAGQNCVGVKRLFIHEAVYDRFEASFVSQTETLVCGPQKDEATDVGPLINEEAAVEVEQWVRDALDSDAELLSGGQREGRVFKPTVLRITKKELLPDCSEVFGPVVSLHKIGSLSEAIIESNRSCYGLHAALFTQNIGNAFRAIRELDVGGVIINDSTDYRIDMMPFGGVKNSGQGREGIKSAITEMTETKVVCFNL